MSLGSDQLDALTAEIERARSKARALSEVIQSSAAIQSSLDRGAILEQVIAQSTRLMQADAGSLMVLDAARRELVYEVATGEAGATIEAFRLKVGTGIAGWVAEHGVPLNIPDAYQDSRFFPDHDRKTGYRTRSVLCVPLKIHGQVIGIAQVINKMPAGSCFTDDDLEIFSDFANLAAVAVETSRMHDEALASARQRERIVQELAVAKEVQASFLPREFPEMAGLGFHAASVPAREVGGDLYDIFEISNDRIGVVLGDVSGKGVSAALYMAKVASDLRLLAEMYDDVGKVLGELNDRLARRAQRGMFVTLVYLQIDVSRGTITYANAGQLPPLFLPGANGPARFLDGGSSPPLGIAPDLEFKQATVDFKPGARIVLYTDGVTECRGPGRELYGLARLQAWLARTMNERHDLVTSLFADVKTFSQGAASHDDMTAVVVVLDTTRTPEQAVEATDPEAPLETVTLSIPANPQYMTILRGLVSRVAEHAGFAEREVRQLTLAVDEGCTNIIRHTYHGQEAGRIDVTLRRCRDRLEIDLADEGAPIDLAQIKSRELADVRPGGLGVHLIQSICDEARWVPGAERGNCLCMVKRVPEPTPSSESTYTG